VTRNKIMNLVYLFDLMAIYWLPGTEPKSHKKRRQFKGFLISDWSRYPQKHPFQNVAAAGRCRITVHVQAMAKKPPATVKRSVVCRESVARGSNALGAIRPPAMVILRAEAPGLMASAIAESFPTTSSPSACA